MADIDLKTETPDTTLPTTGFLFGADSQAAASPSVFTVQSVATTLLGSTTLTGATITTSSPVIDASQTWNASGVTFTGLKLNVTDTASASGSLLMDLQVGGVSQFSVSKSSFASVSNLVSNSLRRTSSGGAGITLTENTSRMGLHSDNALVGYLDGQRFIFNSSTAFGWSPGSANNGAQDLVLGRRAAANLRFGAADAAAPVAQTLSVQSVVAGTSNTAGANLTITGSQGTGTGAGGSIVFQVAPAGSSGTAQNALVDALTISGDQTVQFASSIALGGSSSAKLARYPGTTFIESDSNGGFSVVPGTSSGISMRQGFFNAGPSSYYGWNSFNGLQTPDLRLYRDAANTLALRNGTNAQTFRVYNTFTSSTNFELFRIVAQSAAAVLIGTEKGSAGGTARALELQTDGTTRLTIATNGDLTIADAENIILGTTTGTKIGTATTQKIGFYNATPVVQPTAVADATDNATAITQLNALLSRMRDLGLIAT